MKTIANKKKTFNYHPSEYSEKVIFSVVSKNPGITIKEIAAITDYSPSHIGNKLRSLKDSKSVRSSETMPKRFSIVRKKKESKLVNFIKHGVPFTKIPELIL